MAGNIETKLIDGKVLRTPIKQITWALKNAERLAKNNVEDGLIVTANAAADKVDVSAGTVMSNNVRKSFSAVTALDLTSASRANTTLVSYKPSAAVQQVETATVAGTIDVAGAGNATVVVTAAGMTNSPKTISVAVANNDTATLVAGKIRTALAADADVRSMFAVSGATTKVILTRSVATENDSTLNISIDNGTCTGLTTAATSANTTAGASGIVKTVLAAKAQPSLETGEIPLAYVTRVTANEVSNIVLDTEIDNAAKPSLWFKVKPRQ